MVLHVDDGEGEKMCHNDDDLLTEVGQKDKYGQ